MNATILSKKNCHRSATVVVKNYSEDRFQILFDEKPDQETISKLKHNGFRWSPRFVAWQRQLTTNAFYACARVIPITVEQLKAMS